MTRSCFPETVIPTTFWEVLAGTEALLEELTGDDEVAVVFLQPLRESPASIIKGSNTFLKRLFIEESFLVKFLDLPHYLSHRKGFQRKSRNLSFLQRNLSRIDNCLEKEYYKALTCYGKL